MSGLSLSGYALFLISLIILFTVQRLLHREIQAIIFMITQRPGLTIGIYSFLLFPGVFIHEFSHLLMAFILRVPIKKFSLLPKLMSNDQLQMGYVLTKQTNFLKDALIGLAPFIVGLVLVGLISVYKLHFTNFIDALFSANASIIFGEMTLITKQNDFGIWFYLAFAVSSTMLPSASDRQSWGQIGIIFIVILVFLVVAGIGPWFLLNVVPRVNQWFSSIAIVVVSSDLIHILILLPSFLLRTFLSRLLRIRVI